MSDPESGVGATLFALGIVAVGLARSQVFHGGLQRKNIALVQHRCSSLFRVNIARTFSPAFPRLLLRCSADKCQ
jgi:hypothetical protein